MKVALVGGAPSSRMLAPYGDTSWEIWATSPSNYQLLSRVTRWFELHKDWQLFGGKNGHEDQTFYVDWLAHHSANGRFQLYMLDQEDVPHATVFPWQELVAEFSPYFFTSSFAWMFALALKEGATEIGIYGADMATLEEYKKQRPHFQHFIWLALQRGVKVTAPYESDIMQPPPLYGVSFTTARGRKLIEREIELKGRIAAMEADEKRIREMRLQLTGAYDDNDYMLTTWTANPLGDT